jgi:sepiapterin reductase
MEKQQQQQQQQQQRMIFINNAGSLGYLGPSWESPSLEDMRQTIDFNVTSSLWLSVRFARYIKEIELQQQQSYQERNNPPIKMGTSTPTRSATIVNISSLVAVSKDFSGMGIYSAGKAAREMYHALVAKDEDQATEAETECLNAILLKTLNYAPGPLETTMTQEIRDSDGLDEDLQSNFQTKLLDPEDSARKLIELLDTNEFESGSHIDYYDL